VSFNVFSWFSSAAKTTEADVVALIGKIKGDVSIAVTDVEKALSWVGGEVPTIVAGLQTALGLAQAVGIVSAPELVAANAAVAALNAFASAQKSGTTGLATDVKSAVSGYVAYQQAASAVAAAKATAAAAPAPVKAS
jgi:hypothetical protein